MEKKPEQVPISPHEVCPLMPGTSVPSVALRRVDGSQVELAALIREKPSVLVFYRGGW